MTTINLRDGLEALYYFDSTYFDNGANELSDQSGYGRHAEAFGGPTIGVEGPNEFNATNFDGSDDEFIADSAPDFADGDVWSAFLITTVPDLPKNEGTAVFGWTDDHRGVLRYTNGDGGNPNPGFYIQNGNNSLRVGNPDPYEHHRWGFVSDGADIFGWSYTNEEIATKLYESIETTEFHPNNVRGKNGHQFDVSVAAVWGRELSYAEIQYLNDLTAPRRAML